MPRPLRTSSFHRSPSATPSRAHQFVKLRCTYLIISAPDDCTCTPAPSPPDVSNRTTIRLVAEMQNLYRYRKWEEIWSKSWKQPRLREVTTVKKGSAQVASNKAQTKSERPTLSLCKSSGRTLLSTLDHRCHVLAAKRGPCQPSALHHVQFALQRPCSWANGVAVVHAMVTPLRTWLISGSYATMFDKSQIVSATTQHT